MHIGLSMFRFAGERASARVRAYLVKVRLVMGYESRLAGPRRAVRAPHPLHAAGLGGARKTFTTSSGKPRTKKGRLTLP